MVTTPRAKSPVAGLLTRGTVEVLISVNVVQLGPVRHGGSHGLWQHGSCVGRVTGVVPSVGSKACVVVPDMGFSFLELGPAAPRTSLEWCTTGRNRFREFLARSARELARPPD